MNLKKITVNDSDDYLRAFQISHIAFEKTIKFPLTIDDAIDSLNGFPPVDRWAAYDEQTGDMMASMCMTPYSIYYYGHKAAMTGIGDVSTLPNFRRSGAIRQCFNEALLDMYHSGQIFSCLYPFSANFYRKFGYESFAEHTKWTMAVEDIPKFDVGGRIEIKSWDEDFDDYMAVYNKSAKNINMMVDRTEFLWSKRLNSTATAAKLVEGMSYAGIPQYVFLWLDDDGQPQAYFTFVRDNDTMVVQELMFSTTQALTAILTFIRTFSSNYKKVSITLPPSIPLDRLSNELPLEKITKKSTFTCMARVINVKEALQLKQYAGNGIFTIKVSDPVINENNKTFEVNFDKKGAVVTEVEAEPDIETDLLALSRFLTGNSGLYDVPYMDGVKINGNSKTLLRFMFRKPAWINDYF